MDSKNSYKTPLFSSFPCILFLDELKKEHLSRSNKQFFLSVGYFKVMSIELPEARILADQLNDAISGLTIETYDLKDVERMMKMGFINKDLTDFRSILEKSVEKVLSRGNTIRV